MILIQKQQIFSVLISKLILWANDQGYKITTGEFERTKLQALANAVTGKGIKNSLHRIRLAADLHLFKHGIYLDQTEDHKPLGEYWESLSTPEYECCWGGRFGDGNHYSIAHEGRK
jgi:hypothetical protein